MQNRKLPVIATLLSALAISPALQAYGGGGGGGGGGSSCEEARFYREQPANNSTVSALSGFTVTASDNTDIPTLEVQVNGEKVEPVITPQRSGDSLLEIKLPAPLATPGKARITFRAKSKDGCATFQPFYVEIKP